jgi:hypothetical protein
MSLSRIRKGQGHVLTDQTASRYDLHYKKRAGTPYDLRSGYLPCGTVGGYRRFGGTYDLHLHPEDEGDMFLRIIDNHQQDHTV